MSDDVLQTANDLYNLRASAQGMLEVVVSIDARLDLERAESTSAAYCCAAIHGELKKRIVELQSAINPR